MNIFHPPLKNFQIKLKVFRFIMAYGEGTFLKLILTYFYCFKYNENNICHSNVQKHVSYTESQKKFHVYYGLCLESAENVF